MDNKRNGLLIVLIYLGSLLFGLHLGLWAHIPGAVVVGILGSLVFALGTLIYYY